MAADIVYTLGGEAGQGVESTGTAFARIHARAGYAVYTVGAYESRIRGGHNDFQIRVANQPVRAISATHSIVIALDKQTIPENLAQIRPGGAVIYDAARKDVDAAEIQAAGVLPVAAPMVEIATSVGNNKIMANTAAVNVAAAMTGLEFQAIETVIRENFASRSEEAANANVAVARAGYEWGMEHYADFRYRLPPAPQDPQRCLTIHGNQAIALGAIAAGCKVIAGYPMTPWSTILEYMTEHRDLGIVAYQTEDEISAISFALGASFAGSRSMTGSSGGGFALMVEHISLAGMNEVPIVIAEVQRGGPATGLPTRNEQSDLLFALHPAHGEFPHIVMAVKDPVDAFYRTAKAFNLAEEWQCPVILLSDLLTSNATMTVPSEALDYERVVAGISRGKLLTHKDLDTRTEPYGRYALTDDGVSPRAIPGHPRAIVHAMSDEHDEFGAITEDPQNRIRMVQKRMRKLEGAQPQMDAPEIYGPATAGLSLVAWGGTYGTLCEVVDRADGRLNLIHFTDLFPFPSGGAEALQRAQRLVAVEQNYTAQLAQYLHGATGIDIQTCILRYDGQPMSPDWVLQQLEELPL